MNESTTLRQGAFLHNNSYKIIRVLGQGGFGITYLAVHVRLNKQVAIKEFFPKALCNRDSATSQVRTAINANSDLVDRLRKKFLKEAEHIAKMDSPYIVKIVDVFEENHTAYYIMDYIEGMSLSDVVKIHGPLSTDRAIDYINKVGNALSYIHSKRVNHLDVKPANIMLRTSDDTPVLVDFGLSKQYDSEGNETSTTPIGISHGFAPMEQYKDGGVKEFSPQTDLYALAATLYFLLTGIVPPQAPSLVDEDLSFPAGFPQWLQPIVNQAMSSKRSDRQGSIKVFCEQLGSNVYVGEETHYDSSNGGIKTDDKQQSDRKFYETDESYSHRKQLESLGNEERKALIKRNLKKASLLLIICGVWGLWVWGAKACNSNNGQATPVDSDTVVVEEVLSPDEPDNSCTLTAIPAVESEEYGAPLSEGEIQDGRGGYDDNAEGYFNMHANNYLTSNRDVYFDGYFSDAKGEYPISLKFEIDDDWFPGVCYYHNIDYNTKLKMAVRFTEEQMIITGNAGGSKFVMEFKPTDKGRWEGRAQNGNHKLKASIKPRPKPV